VRELQVRMETDGIERVKICGPLTFSLYRFFWKELKDYCVIDEKEAKKAALKGVPRTWFSGKEAERGEDWQGTRPSFHDARKESTGNSFEAWENRSRSRCRRRSQNSWLTKLPTNSNHPAHLGDNKSYTEASDPVGIHWPNVVRKFRPHSASSSGSIEQRECLNRGCLALIKPGIVLLAEESRTCRRVAEKRRPDRSKSFRLLALKANYEA